MNLTGHYIVAGASRGIGAACADRLEAEGAVVTRLSRSSGVDLSDAIAAEAAITAAFKHHGAIEGLICTAGGAKQAPLASLDPAALRAGMEAKYFTYANTMLPCLKLMALQGRGVVVPIIGIGGKVASITHLPGGAANAALMLLSTGLGQAYAAQGVRVIGINPGYVTTERFGMAIRARAAQHGIDENAAKAQIAAAQPSGKLTTPDQIAELALMLLGPASSALNGTVIAADGAANPVL